ncbi:class I SAM-dependent methyltransferase [soil metagenome]
MTDEHAHGTPQTAGTEHPFGRDYWEDRYSAPGLAWSGNPNPVLVTETSSLAPGRALDIGSGEGGDAFWLASRGWSVTGVDIAVNALNKARTRAEAADPAAAASIDWQQHDLTEWSPPRASFDLVSAQFMHLPEPERSRLFRSLAAAVAPGGTLLIVGHDIAGMDVGEHQGHMVALMFTAQDVVAAIDGEGLTVEIAESRGRQGMAPDVTATQVRDIVVRAKAVTAG